MVNDVSKRVLMVLTSHRTLGAGGADTGEPFGSRVRRDGRLVTGRNPASSVVTARETVRLLTPEDYR